jgi:uncharacterized protein (TIGR02186 family)
MKKLWLNIFVLLLFGVFALPSKSYARAIIADLSPRKIDISHDFLGTKILVYGARNDAGNIAIVVRGPEKDYLVREKKKVAGIWVNGDAARFNDISSFYSASLMSSLEKIRNDNLLDKLEIGLKSKKFVPVHKTDITINDEKFQDALKSHLERKNLFNATPYEISFWGETLFRSSIDFPKNILPGVYHVDVYLFNDGLLSSVQSTPLIVDKVGFEAFVYNFAHTNSALYGAICVLMAIFLGFFARVLFARE